MSEVLEVISKIVLLFALFVMAWNDYKTQLLEIRQLLVFGVLGILLCGSWSDFYQAMGGALPGVLVLVVAWCSGESIGFGDGWLFVMTGLFLGFARNLVLLFGTFVLAGLFAVGCLMLKKKGKNDSMALVPFALTAYVLFVL